MKNIKRVRPRHREKGLIFGLISLILVAVTAHELEIIPFWVGFIGSSSLIKIISYPFLACLIILFLGLGFRVSLWLKYRPETLRTVELLDFPSVSVVMPAYNEEKLVSRAVEAVLQSDYPGDKLELICINDGSTDKTLTVLEGLRQRDPARIKVISFSETWGKKKPCSKGSKKLAARLSSPLTLTVSSSAGLSKT